MATRTKKRRNTFRHHVAPFAPLVLAAAMNLAPSKPAELTTTHPTTTAALTPAMFSPSCSAPDFPSNDATDMDETGCGFAGNGGKEAAQNSAKNNFCAVNPASPMTIADMVSLQQKVEQDSSINFGNPRTHPFTSAAGPVQQRSKLVSLGEGDQVVVQGFVLIARQEGSESVNCGTKVPDKPVFHDIHVSLVQHPGDDECTSIVVEMTPHHRPAEWTAGLVNEVAHAKLPVRVTGQRMFDSSHSPCTNGTGVPGDPRRASLWEVHPIYNFEVCPKGACSSGGWVPLELWKPDQVDLP
jgi:hypothetical protein